MELQKVLQVSLEAFRTSFLYLRLASIEFPTVGIVVCPAFIKKPSFFSSEALQL
jgi:hypothetical protein